MISNASLAKVICFTALTVILTCALIVSGGAEQTINKPLPAITRSGQHITSLFDGLVPNPQVRDRLVRGISPAVSPALPNLRSSDIGRSLGIGPRANAGSCPTGGICAQPGTTSGPGEFCEDAFGCGVDVHNQTNGDDFHKGTLELYDCAQCCVDWVTCDISLGPPPPPPDPPPHHRPCLVDGDPCECSTGEVTDGCSPIIIDTEGEGFHLTSVEDGVLFDIRGDGHPIKIAWTAPRYHNAFLVLDRNGDGRIESGKELFGNFTQQPKSDHPNGFLALTEFDKPENGGNGDQVVDEHDAVFSKLRLWIDENHDGVCQPGELHTLAEIGIYSLSLQYYEARRKDAFGNQFRYRAFVNPGERRDFRDWREHEDRGTHDVGRWAYDVFFR